jgi:hypothetical protein
MLFQKLCRNEGIGLYSVGGDSGIASGSESDGESGCEEAIVKESETRKKWVVK